MNQQELTFCETVRQHNVNFTNSERKNIFYEIELLKGTNNKLKEMEQTIDTKEKVKKLKKQIKKSLLKIRTNQ